MATPTNGPTRATPTPAPAAPTPDPHRLIRVRATQMGYFDLIRRREGDIFTVPAHAFSAKWMEPVSANTPERITTGVQALRQQHDEIMRSKAPNVFESADAVTGASHVLGD